MKSKNCILLLIVLLFLGMIQSSTAQEKKPAWVNQRPVSSAYYVGIGISMKNDHPGDYQQIAKDEALRDLSSEITVNISSEFVMSLAEQAGLVAEEIQSQVRSSTQANLEGYEMAGAWENETEYWVYYRLSKSLYAENREARKEKALNLSRDMFGNAQRNDQAKNVASAFTFYVQAFTALEEFLGESMQIEYNGQSIYLQNEIFSALQNLVSQMEFQSTETKFTVKIGQPLKTPLAVSASFKDKNGFVQRLVNLPVRFSFVKGAGQIVERAHTDMNGAAYCQVASISATDKIQIIKAQPDVSGQGQESSTPLSQSLLKKLSLPETKYILSVSGLTIYIDANETHLGRTLDVPFVEPQLKNGLSSYGYAFTEDAAQADLMIELKAASRQGAEVYRLFSAFVDVTLSVTDLSTGTEVYKDALNGIKGVSLDYDKAGMEALKNAGKKIAELLPDVIKKIQN